MREALATPAWRRGYRPSSLPQQPSRSGRSTGGCGSALRWRLSSLPAQEAWGLAAHRGRGNPEAPSSASFCAAPCGLRLAATSGLCSLVWRCPTVLRLRSTSQGSGPTATPWTWTRSCCVSTSATPSTRSAAAACFEKYGPGFRAWPAGPTGATVPPQPCASANTSCSPAVASSRGTRSGRSCSRWRSIPLCEPRPATLSSSASPTWTTWFSPDAPTPSQAAFRDLQAAAAAAGLVVEVSKCVLVPTAGQASCVDASAFPAGLNTRQDGNFELLGAPIWDPEFCESYTAVETCGQVSCLPRGAGRPRRLSDWFAPPTPLQLLLQGCLQHAHHAPGRCRDRPAALRRGGQSLPRTCWGPARSRTGPGSRPPSASEMVVLDSGKSPSTALPPTWPLLGFLLPGAKNSMPAMRLTGPLQPLLWSGATLPCWLPTASLLRRSARPDSRTSRPLWTEPSWPSCPSPLPAKQSGPAFAATRGWCVAVRLPVRGTGAALGGPLLSGSAPHAAPAPCCKHRWLLPTVRRDCRPLRGPRPRLSVWGGQSEAAQPPPDCGRHPGGFCWLEPRG